MATSFWMRARWRPRRRLVDVSGKPRDWRQISNPRPKPLRLPMAPSSMLRGAAGGGTVLSAALSMAQAERRPDGQCGAAAISADAITNGNGGRSPFTDGRPYRGRVSAKGNDRRQWRHGRNPGHDPNIAASAKIDASAAKGSAPALDPVNIEIKNGGTTTPADGVPG
jgi:hypothetical protein